MIREPGDMQETVLELLPTLDRELLAEVARVFVGITGYLDEHAPSQRGTARRFKCSGSTYHCCSFRGPHQEGCRAIGGDGDLVGASEHAESCDADCDESATEEVWCRCAGFDCPDCAAYDELLGILAKAGAVL